MSKELDLALQVIARVKNLPVNELTQHIESMGKPHDELLTKKDVAARLNISLPTVDRLINKGALHKITLTPQLVRISLRSVERYLAVLMQNNSTERTQA